MMTSYGAHIEGEDSKAEVKTKPDSDEEIAATLVKIKTRKPKKKGRD